MKTNNIIESHNPISCHYCSGNRVKELVRSVLIEYSILTVKEKR